MWTVRFLQKYTLKFIPHHVVLCPSSLLPFPASLSSFLPYLCFYFWTCIYFLLILSFQPLRSLFSREFIVNSLGIYNKLEIQKVEKKNSKCLFKSHALGFFFCLFFCFFFLSFKWILFYPLIKEWVLFWCHILDVGYELGDRTLGWASEFG